MLYSLLVLTFGIYLGQEYPIPSIKNNVLLLYTLYKKEETTNVDKPNDNSGYKSHYTPGYSDKLLDMLRKYVA